MKRKVTKLEIVDGSLKITWDDGDFIMSTLNVEKAAELLEKHVWDIAQDEAKLGDHTLMKAIYG